MKATAPLVILLLLASACTKQPDNCAEILQIRIVGAKTNYFVGDELLSGRNSLAMSCLYQSTPNDNPNIIARTTRIFDGSVTNLNNPK